MLLDTLGTIVLGNLLNCKNIIRADQRTIRAGENF